MLAGILYPRSGAYPEAGADFLDAIKLCLKQAGIQNDIQITATGIGFGGEEKEVYQRAEDMLVANKVDVLVAFVGLRVLPVLEPLVFAHGKPLIVVNPGADYPQNWITQPGVIHLNLNHAFLCWLTGSQVSGKAVVATSFYDCGYLHMAALTQRFAQNGGEIIYNYVNNTGYGADFQVNELSSFLDENPGTTNLVCVYDTKPAALLYQHLATHPQAANLQIHASPMMLETGALQAAADTSLQIRGFLPWLAGENSQDFIACFEKANNPAPGPFALLGWETGLALMAIKNSGAAATGTDAVNDFFAKNGLQGPRGHMQFDADTHYFKAPVVHCTVMAGHKPTYQIQDFPEAEWQAMTGTELAGHSSGWTNTYLCY